MRRVRDAALPVRPLAGLTLVLALGWGATGCGGEEPPAGDAPPGETVPAPAADTPPPPPPDTLDTMGTDTSDTAGTTDTADAADTADTAGTITDEGPPPREAEGVVGVTGTDVAPTAILRREEGPTLGLTGTLARELRRLSGARVRVSGRDAATPVGPGIEVAGYEILEIEGETPLVGNLQQVDASWRLQVEDEEPWILEGLPARGLAEGMKIWVIGDEIGPRQFRVTSHGIVAPLG